MKQKEHIVSPANWPAIKANIPGIADATREVQRTTAQTATPKFTNIEILNQKANHSDSMRILKENGLRPVTCQEILFALDRDPVLKEQLKGKWFWLEGKGTKMSEYHTLQPDYTLKKGRSKDPEKNIYCDSGNQPLVFGVNSDTMSAEVGRRFYLYALDAPSDVAPVVVGVRIGHEVVAQKILDLQKRQL